MAASNMASLGRRNHRRGGPLQLLRANAATLGGLPLSDASVDKIMTDLPFGKQFGSLEENHRLYPSVLRELARVLRVGGLAVLLTSQQNREVMQTALQDMAQSWNVEHRRSFRLFVKLDACIYVLRRVQNESPGSLGLLGSGGRVRLGGATGLFPWEDGSTWHEQWAKHRPALVRFGQSHSGTKKVTGKRWGRSGGSCNLEDL